MPSLPDAKRAAKGLSLKGLIKYMVPYTKAKSRDVVIKALNEKVTKGKMPAVTATCVDISGKVRTPHKVTVIGLDKDIKNIVGQTRIICDCDCEDHTFTWEYALWAWGAARIKRSNGEPAVVKNPGSYPGTCKHVAKVLLTIAQKKM